MKFKYIEYEDTGTPVLDELGLQPGLKVKYRVREDDNWKIGTLRGDSKDGSLAIIDKDGRWRSIMPDKILIQKLGPRGGKSWTKLNDSTVESQ